MVDDDKRWVIIQTTLHKDHLERVFKLLRGGGVEPLLIKGWAAVRHYPEGEGRTPGDLDLCVSPAQFEKAIKILKALEISIPVDIHLGLRHLDTLPLEKLLERSELIRVGESDIRILCDEDHLRVMAVHWLNDGGAYREKLKDIHFAVEDRAEDFDWDKCLNAVDVRRRRWIVCAILLSHKYFGTKIENTPIAGEKELPRWLIRAIEKEWASPVRLQPVTSIFIDPKRLWQQFRKRVPPNPLQATIELGGDFDRYPRAIYQTADIFYRIFATRKRLRIVSRIRKI
ncbi:MAG TPA: nucleotidyltransferase family protein [Pyrinomonadaceae bacterium]|jgi:hypothetical protein|nr:nucleotidyltransferase family protein [Pyrinomonadaceae bacterium]